MTVAELISKLSEFPADLQVVMETNGDVTRQPDWQPIQTPFVAQMILHEKGGDVYHCYKGYDFCKGGDHSVVCISDWRNEPYYQ